MSLRGGYPWEPLDSRSRSTMSHEGGPWEDDLQLTYERIDS